MQGTVAAVIPIRRWKRVDHRSHVSSRIPASCGEGLTRWRFEPPGELRTLDVVIDFEIDDGRQAKI